MFWGDYGRYIDCAYEQFQQVWCLTIIHTTKNIFKTYCNNDIWSHNQHVHNNSGTLTQDNQLIYLFVFCVTFNTVRSYHNR